MKAMILAAGQGTRMQPLSRVVPKPLLPIEGRPLLYWLLRHLKQNGVTEAVVNAHHLSTQLNQWIDANTPSLGARRGDHELPFTRVMIERDLLGTAGGIANARMYLDTDPVVVMNVDQLFRPRFGRARDLHRGGHFLATLFLVRNPHLAQVRVDSSRVTEILRRPDPTDRSLWAFTGTYLLSPEAVTRIPRTGFQEMGPILRRWMQESKLGAFLVEDIPWREVGTPETYLEATRDIALDFRQDLLGDPSPAGSTPVEGFGFIEAGAVIGPRAEIRESIILSGAEVAAGSKLYRVILGPGTLAAGTMERLVAADGTSRGISVFSGDEEKEIQDVLRYLEWVGPPQSELASPNELPPPNLSLRMITAGRSTRQIARGSITGGTFIVVRNPQTPQPTPQLTATASTQAGATPQPIYPRRTGPNTPDENESFVYVADYLRTLKVRVPEVRFFDKAKGLMLQEDLGTVSVYDQVKASGTTERDRERLYTEAVCVLHQVHSRGPEPFDPSRVMSPAYDSAFVLNYEAGYFHRELLENVLKLPIPFERLLPEYTRAARECIDECVPGFLHRDYQSRNLMVTPTGLAVIDFQGARMGPPEYDLASLLLDPYVALPAALRDVLVERYLTLNGTASGDRRRAALKRYRMCGINRMLQVLGAFAYLGVKLGKPGFIEHAPVAVNHLRELASPDMKGLASLTGRLTSLVMALPAGNEHPSLKP